MTPRTALGALHIGALMFGLTGVFGKLAAASPSIIVFGRAAFAVLALALFARFASSTPWQKLYSADLRRLLLSGLLLAGHWVSFFIAVKVAGVAIATLGFATFPAFTVILEGLIFRERIRANEMVLVVLVSIGLVLVTPDFDLASQATSGLIWAVASGLLFSLLSLNNRASGSIPPVQAALCQNVVVALCLLPVAAPGLSEVRALDWLWIGLLGCSVPAWPTACLSPASKCSRHAPRRWCSPWSRCTASPWPGCCLAKTRPCACCSAAR